MALRQCTLVDGVWLTDLSDTCRWNFYGPFWFVSPFYVLDFGSCIFPKQFTVKILSQFFLKMCPPFVSLLVSALFRPLHASRANMVTLKVHLYSRAHGVVASHPLRMRKAELLVRAGVERPWLLRDIGPLEKSHGLKF